jgi:hypothetical protein
MTPHIYPLESAKSLNIVGSPPEEDGVFNKRITD